MEKRVVRSSSLKHLQPNNFVIVCNKCLNLIEISFVLENKGKKHLHSLNNVSQ